MNKPELFNEDHQATYCPEDDKLRLYVGRVPRDEYEALRAEGWTSTPKQSEAGQGEFAAVWTPEREDTALSYAGVITDEDAGPAERAADRAERFGGYLDNNLARATGHADRYDSRDPAHGYQSKAAAVRAADRHDRIADRAVNAWDKADYWQRRTEGVISSALYKSTPGVRMGRIKVLEAELRKSEKSNAEYCKLFSLWKRVEAETDEAEATKLAAYLAGAACYGFDYRHPRPETTTRPEYYAKNGTSLYSLLTDEAGPITGHEAAAMWLEDREEPNAEGGRYTNHLRLRLAYENQMLEAQGGRAASLEMEKGGTVNAKVIAKVNKSAKTGRVVSVHVITHRVEGWHYRITNEPGTPYALKQVDTERLSPGAYHPPTEESRATLAAFEAARKAAQDAHKAKVPPCPLINPTDEDAERLQALMNEENESDPWRKVNPGPQSEVRRMTQAEYQRISGGSYSSGETIEVCAMGKRPVRSNMWTSKGEAHNKRIGPVLCKVRTSEGKNYAARRVIILTDKPRKPLPAAVWVAHVPAETAPASTVEA